METEQVISFLSDTLGQHRKNWSSDGVREIAFKVFPDQLMGPHGGLLRADIKLLWARWFVEAVWNPRANDAAGRGHSFVFAEAAKVVGLTFGHLPMDEQYHLSSAIARLITEKVAHDRRVRRSWTSEDRRFVLDRSGPRPHCWICGYRFGEWAIDEFLRLDKTVNRTSS
jgi:hypothetical protein